MPGRFVVAVVDNDDAVRAATASRLKRAGYRVRTYASGDAFLAAQLPGDSDCILIDMRMPGTDGLGVLRALGARERMPPVLVLADHGAIPDAVAAMKLGAADILEKPYRVKALLQAVGQALALHPQRKAGALDQDAAAKVAALSRRQREMLRLILDGQPNKAIARQLELSLRTVEVHRAQLLEKLGVRGLADAIRLAIAAGMLQS